MTVTTSPGASGPLTTVAYTRYEWDCQACGFPNDARETDPAGETVECEHCHAANYVMETR